MSSVLDRIFIDESGSIKLVEKTGYYVTSYVFCKEPELLRGAMNKQITRTRVYGKYPDLVKELKFNHNRKQLKKLGYSPEAIQDYTNQIHDVRVQTLNLIKDNCDGIFVSCLDNKTIREKTWTHVRLANWRYSTI